MRVHVAIVCRDLGGTGTIAAVVLQQARELAQAMRVTLVSDSFQPSETLPCVQVRVPDLRFLGRLRDVPDELAFAYAARRALRTLKLDFVLFHAHATAYLSPPEGVPHGLYVHSDIHELPKGVYDARLTAFYGFVTPRAYRGADIVFAPGRVFAEIARQRGAKNVIWLPHGIDPAEIGALDGAPPARTSPRLRILFVGRLSIEKGIDVLVDACTSLDVDYELDIVGTGPLEESLRARTTDRIRLLGVIPRRELGAVYRAHDVFCLPALSEAFGLVVAEALVCGLPVVATNAGGIPDLVTHGGNGLLVPPGDARALAAALATLARDESLRARLAAQARASVLPRFEWRAIGEQMRAAVASLIRR